MEDQLNPNVPGVSVWGGSVTLLLQILTSAEKVLISCFPTPATPYGAIRELRSEQTGTI